MLTHYISKSHVIDRMHNNYFGYLFERYILCLHKRGYKAGTIKLYCQCIEHFGQWLKNKKTYKRCNLSIEMNIFLKKHLPICTCLTPKSKEVKSIRAAINQLLKITHKNEEIFSSVKYKISKTDKIVNSFCDYLSEVCGVAENTKLNRKKYVIAFLNKLKICNLSQIEMLSPDQITWFIKKYSCYYKRGSMGVVLTSLRSFLQYLLFKGYDVKKLISTIPRIPNWRLSTVPKLLDDDQIKIFLSVFNTTSASGKRDYAMARCLTDLGLRCCEVAKIKIKDINWHEAILKISTGKSKRENQLPIPASLGKAISDYLMYGRPESKSEFVFIFHRAPFGENIHTTTVRGAIRRAFKKAGFDPVPSTHIFRHSFATKLLTSGVSLKEIADMLRHRCIDTTMIYVKVDMPHLRDVSMPWFGRML